MGGYSRVSKKDIALQLTNIQLCVRRVGFEGAFATAAGVCEARWCDCWGDSGGVSAEDDKKLSALVALTDPLLFAT